MEIVRPKIFSKYKSLICGITTRSWGDFKEPAEYKKNSKRLAKKLKIDPARIVKAGIQNGSDIVFIDKNKKNYPGDCLVSSKRNIYLMVTVADCVPVMFFEPQRKIIALVHAGWKGLAKSILKKAVKKICMKYGIRPENLIFYIGPSISKCHFEVRPAVAGLFPASLITKRSNKLFIDLKNAAKSQLLSARADTKKIEVSSDCTYCLSKKYFSFRREGKKTITAQAAFLGMKK
ncbi:peptidoglycan editing factor PgeF [Candidatus Parcubacteria bacterium]|nr:MAG: peptidoglycan editing factor PgeF [Candidatus Parcubacteria bacterium]